MMELSQLNPLKRGRLSGLLGLSLDGSRFEGVCLRRTNGSVEIQQSFSVSLSLDPLTAPADLVAQEIRNHLDAAGVRERTCVLCLPLKWALTTAVEVPELSAEDRASFLQIEAEKGFPCDATTLQIVTSQSPEPAGKTHALLAGIPRTHLEALQRIFRAAKLNPIGFTLGVVALQAPEAESSKGVLALAIGENNVALQVSYRGGIVALRALEGTIEIEGPKRVLHTGNVAREVRITLGQLPAEVRETLKTVRIFGPRDLAQQLADELELRLEPFGLKVEMVNRYAPDQFGLHLPAEAPVSSALSLAATRLAGRKIFLDFLPPRVRPWQQMARRYASGRLRTAGAVGLAAVLLLAGLFLFQQWQIFHYTSQWNSLAPKVKELEKTQAEIRQFRPWFDNLQGLRILRQLTLAFPEEGSVSARTVEIRDLNNVSCTGVARDHQSLLKTLERLQASGGVSDLKVSQIRGRTPLQFTFDFRWIEGAKE